MCRVRRAVSFVGCGVSWACGVRCAAGDGCFPVRIWIVLVDGRGAVCIIVGAAWVVLVR